MMTIEQRREATKVLGVPLELPGREDYAFLWDKPVPQTQYSQWGERFREFKADMFGNNFGVGDIVLYDPRREVRNEEEREQIIPMEGIVANLYQYIQYDPTGKWIYNYTEKIFGAKVDFAPLNPDKLPFTMFLPAEKLEAQTDTHVKFDNYTMRQFSDLTDIPFRDFEKTSQAVKALFRDPVTRALWMGYRAHHIMEKTELKVLNETVERLAEEFKNHPLPADRAGLWLKKYMRPRVSQEWAAFMKPYLLGEKEATYHPTKSAA